MPQIASLFATADIMICRKLNLKAKKTRKLLTEAARIIGLAPSFSGTKAVLNKAAITIDGKAYPINAIADNTFYENTTIEEMDFSAATSTIDVGDGAFEGTSAMRHVKFNKKAGWYCGAASFCGSGIEEITIYGSLGMAAFLNCKNLKDVDFAAACDFIGYNAFAGCSSLENIKLKSFPVEKDWGDGYYSKSAMRIYEGAFDGSGLKSLTIPAYTSFYIEANAFKNTPLTSVVSYIEYPEALDTDAFTGIPAEATLSVPFGTQYMYEYTTGWDHFYGQTIEREWAATDVQEVETSTPNTQHPSTIYDMQGIRQTNLKKGLNIIRQADGTTIKVVQK